MPDYIQVAKLFSFQAALYGKYNFLYFFEAQFVVTRQPEQLFGNLVGDWQLIVFLTELFAHGRGVQRDVMEDGVYVLLLESLDKPAAGLQVGQEDVVHVGVVAGAVGIADRTAQQSLSLQRLE